MMAMTMINGGKTKWTYHLTKSISGYLPCMKRKSEELKERINADGYFWF
jgi:hypothetical protein